MDNKRWMVCAVSVWLATVGYPAIVRATPVGLTEAVVAGNQELGSDFFAPDIRPAEDHTTGSSAAIPAPFLNPVLPSALSPDFLARPSIREWQIGSVNVTKRLSAGFNVREERDEWGIPDLGSSGSLSSGFDAGSVAQDIHASSNRLQGQFPRKSAMRMNFLKLDSEEFRMDVTQHPSRTGLRFHHMGTGLRVEAERRYINSATSVFVGVRLLEDRRVDPTIGCSVQSSTKNAFETRNFCGFRLRVGL